MPTATLRDNGELRELLVDPGETMLYGWKNVLIFVWLGDASVELMRRLKPILVAYAREAGMVSIVSLVTTVSDLPDDSKRRAYKDLITAHGATIAHVVTVLEREGFVGSAIRGLMTGLLMVSGQLQKLHVANSMEQAAVWLAPKHAITTGVELDPDELVRAVQDARTRAKGAPSPTEDAR